MSSITPPPERRPIFTDPISSPHVSTKKGSFQDVLNRVRNMQRSLTSSSTSDSPIASVSASQLSYPSAVLPMGSVALPRESIGLAVQTVELEESLRKAHAETAPSQHSRAPFSDGEINNLYRGHTSQIRAQLEHASVSDETRFLKACEEEHHNLGISKLRIFDLLGLLHTFKESQQAGDGRAVFVKENPSLEELEKFKIFNQKYDAVKMGFESIPNKILRKMVEGCWPVTNKAIRQVKKLLAMSPLDLEKMVAELSARDLQRAFKISDPMLIERGKKILTGEGSLINPSGVSIEYSGPTIPPAPFDLPSEPTDKREKNPLSIQSQRSMDQTELLRSSASRRIRATAPSLPKSSSSTPTTPLSNQRVVVIREHHAELPSTDLALSESESSSSNPHMKMTIEIVRRIKVISDNRFQYIMTSSNT